jgi:hypothetical protein
VLKREDGIIDRGSDRRLNGPPSHGLSVRDKEQKIPQHLTVCPCPTWKYPESAHCDFLRLFPPNSVYFFLDFVFHFSPVLSHNLHILSL